MSSPSEAGPGPGDMARPDSAATAALFESAQRLRTEWASALSAHFRFTLGALAALWAFFLAAYVNSLSSPAQYTHVQPIFLLAAAAPSALLVGIWRLHTRRLDDATAQLYAELVLYEGELGAAPEHGTAGLLVRSVSAVRPAILDPTLGANQRAAIVARLADSRRLGERGHRGADLCSLLAIVVMLLKGFEVLTQVYDDPSRFTMAVVLYLAVGIGLILVLRALTGYQQEPTPADVERARAAVRGH